MAQLSLAFRAAPARPTDDATLVGALARRDAGAMEQLYERHHRVALGVARRITGDHILAEEVVQDAFVQLWRHAESFDPDRACLRTWLMTLVHNRSIDRLRYRRRRPALSLEEMALLGHAESASEAHTIDDVHEALERLDPERRYLLERVYFEGLTREEVVAETGMPLGTLKRRLREALESMRQSLKTSE